MKRIKQGAEIFSSGNYFFILDVKYWIWVKDFSTWPHALCWEKKFLKTIGRTEYFFSSFFSYENWLNNVQKENLKFFHYLFMGFVQEEA